MSRRRAGDSKRGRERDLDLVAWAAVVILVSAFPLGAGGAPPLVVVLGGFASLVVGVTTLLRQRRQRRPPAGLLIGLGLTWFALVHWLPLGTGFTAGVAPRLVAFHEELALAAPDRISVFPGNTLLEVCRLSSLVVLYWVGSQLPRDAVMWAVLAAGSVTAAAMGVHLAVGADQVFNLYQPVDLPPGTKLGAAPFINPNHLAQLMVVSGLVGVGLTWHLQRATRLAENSKRYVKLQRRVFLAGVSSIACVVALIAAGSQGGWLLGACGLIGAAVILSSKSRQTLVRALAVGTGVLALAMAFTFTFLTVEDAAIERKIATNLDALRLLELSPVLGTGRGTFVDLHSASHPGGAVVFTHAESSWVGFLLECGPVATLVLAIAVGIWAVGAWRGCKRRRDRVAILAVIAVVVGAAWEFALDLNGVAAPVVLLAGCLAAPRKSASWLVWAVLGSATLLSALAVPAISKSRVPSERWAARILSGEMDAEMALSARPLDGRLHFAAAKAQADPTEALQAAVRASRLSPDSVDAPIYAAHLALTLEKPEMIQEHLSRAFARLQAPPAADWALYIRSTFGSRRIASALVETPQTPKAALLTSLLGERPGFADDVSALLLAADPADVQALRTRIGANVALGRNERAVELARDLVQLEPGSAFAHRDWARAVRARGPSGEVEADIQQGLLSALTHDLDNPGIVKEAFVRSVLIAPTADGIGQADELLKQLQLAASQDEEATRYRSLRSRLDQIREP